MDRLCTEDLERLAKLESPTRNRYFYGKLLTERHFELEQRYFNRKRWLLNRLTLGAGVVCGLNVVKAADGKLQLAPGVALDGFGREIVVPEPSRPFDPAALTDECGQPTGERAKGPVTICLAYHECDVEPVPVRVAECETEQRCAPSLVRERYMVLVLDGEPPAAAPACRHPGLLERPAAEIHRALVEDELKGCPAPGRACVPLARVEGDAMVRDVRSLVYSAPLLYELILCLAQRVEQCCHALTLLYVSGDAQQGQLGKPLHEDLVVRVVDSAGHPVANQEVTFRVQGGAGQMQAPHAPQQKVSSGANGLAAARWVLGPKAPLQTATASLDNGASIGFHAIAEVRTTTAKAPRVTALWPAQGSVIKLSDGDPVYDLWKKKAQPYLELTFDQAMDKNEINNPGAWLGVYWYRPGDSTPGTIRRLKVKYIGPTTPGANTPLPFLFTDLKVTEARARYLVLVRAENKNIESAAAPAVLLDAEYAGSQLAAARLDELWNMQPGDSLAAKADDKNNFRPAAAPPALPSGEGNPGGVFHSVFVAS